jgi:hypothetical protein
LHVWPTRRFEGDGSCALLLQGWSLQVILESKTNVQIPRDTIFVPLKSVSGFAARQHDTLVYSNRTNGVTIAVL